MKRWRSKKTEEEERQKIKVKFDLEENARELFLNALSSIDPTKKKESKEKIKKFSSFSSTPKKRTIDLHGCNVKEAKSKVDSIISNIIVGHITPCELTIITGKGLHSADGEGVLISEIYFYIKNKYADFIKRIDDPPSESKLIENEGALPIKGHFVVLFGK